MRSTSRSSSVPERTTSMPANPMRWLGALAMLFALSALILVVSAEDKGRLQAPAIVPPVKAAATPDATVAPTPPAAAGPATIAGGLLGTAVADLQARFGPAAFVRTEGRSRLHRFADRRCTLFAFTFRTEDGERVEHVESHALDGTPAIGLAECIESLQRSRTTLAAAR